MSKKPRSILIGTKICLCAMLMAITAGVASASVAGDFAFTNVGDSPVNANTINNLALEVVIPDGVNGNTEDILLKDGGTVFYSGDALVAFPALGGVTGVGYKEDGTGGFQGTEPVVLDLDSDGVWTANADTDIDGASPAVGFPLTSVKDPDWTDLYFYDDAAGAAWATGADMIFNDDGAIYYDVGLDTLEAGTGSENLAGVFAEPAGWSAYYHDDVNDGGQYAPGADWIGLDDDGDAVLTDAADSLEIDGADGLLSAGAVLIDVVAADEICTDNSDLALAACVYSDTDGTPCDGTQGSGLDFVGAGCELGTDVLVVTGNNWATNETPIDASTDWFKENFAEELTYSAAADTTIDGTAPAAGTVIGTIKDVDWTTLYFYDAGTGIWEPGSDMVFTDDGNIYFDATLSSDVLEAGTSLENGLGASAEPANWDLWFRDAVNSNAYNGTVDWIGVDAGGFGSYSTSADTDVYTTGGLTDADALTDFGADCDGVSAGTQPCLHTGTGTLDAGESILIDEGDDQGAAPNGLVDEENDELTSIEIKTTGTATDADLSAVKVWLDAGVADTFEPGTGDTLLGTAVWDSVDTWDLGGLSTAIPAGGIKLFVSLDIDPTPAGGTTFILGLDQNGVVVASTNDGPTDADADPTAVGNTLTIPGGGGGGGGSGGSSGSCGDGILDSTETCDDGGRTAGDGCNVYCSLEDGYVWDPVNGEVITEAEAAAEGIEVPVDETVATEATPETVTEEALPETDVADVAANFNDYDDSHWAAQYIAKLFLANIMTGFGGTNDFGVAEGTTRAEIVKIALLSNGIEVPASVDVKPFNDTPVDQWYTPYVAKAANLGIVSGYDDGNFRPGNKVNRAEALKILLLAKGIDVSGHDLSSLNFNDVSDSIWYAFYVAYAVDNGLIQGYDDGTFRGGNDILRAEVAKLTVLIMLLEIL